MNLYKFLFL